MRSEAEPPHDSFRHATSPIVQRPVMSPADFDWDMDDPAVQNEQEGHGE